MKKPYNNFNRITKENSMFNLLGADYSSNQLEHQLWFYETAMLLVTEIPKDQLVDEKYYPRAIENHIRLRNQEYMKAQRDKEVPKKSMKDVWKYLYEDK